jgi:NitT/TauT family transport system substrate-binding protein
MRRLIGLVALASLIGVYGSGEAAAEQKLPVKLGVAGAGCICYLPSVLAKQLGAYERHGLDAELIAFKSGSAGLTALLGGTVDALAGYYEHTIVLRPKNKDVRAIVVQSDLPGHVLVISPKHAGEVRSLRDLEGKTVGVSGPGSSTDFFLKSMLRKNGIEPAKVPVIGVGVDQGAVAAQEQGQVAAAVMQDPGATLLTQKHPEARILADTRTEKDAVAVFGAKYTSSSIYAPAEWIEKHPKESQALASAIIETLRWIHSHTPEEIAAKMPAEYVGPDAKLYVAALRNDVAMFSRDGLVDPPAAAAVLELLVHSVPEIAAAKIDVATTYTNRFAEKANAELDKAK